MFDNVCSLPLSSDLFAQDIHPTEPLLAVGLYSGHVETFRLPPVTSTSGEPLEEAKAASHGRGKIETSWRTRRHRGSCRTLCFSSDGESLYSAGFDSILKVASSSTGRVTSKILVPRNPDSSSTPDLPALVHALTPQTLLLATDSSRLHIYDLRHPLYRPQQTHQPHDDYISSLTPLLPTSTSSSGLAKQWLTTGGSTVAVTDLRRGVISRSEDQEEELLSSTFVTGLPSRRSTGDKAIVGGAGGVLTLWERNQWDDQNERVVVSGGKGGGESVDCLFTLPASMAGGCSYVVACGMGNGSIKFVRDRKVVQAMEIKHDVLDEEAVVALGADVGGRLISGGGKVVKVWEEIREGHPLSEVEQDEEAERADDTDDDDDEDSESAEDKRNERKKRRKHKKRKGGQKAAQPAVLGFKGLD